MVAIETLNGPHGATSRINWSHLLEVLRARPAYLAQRQG